MPDLRACTDGSPEQNAGDGKLRTLRLPYSTETQVGRLISYPSMYRARGSEKVMDASHLLVGGLTVVSLSLLIWIELRTRRQADRRVVESRSEVNVRPSAGTGKG
jgi:hypothetical protein